MKHGPIALRCGRGHGWLYGVCLASRSATACPRSVTRRWCAGCSTGAHAQEAEAQDRACASHKSRRVHTSVIVAHMLSRAALRTEVLPPYPHLYHSAMYHLWHCHKALAKQSKATFCMITSKRMNTYYTGKHASRYNQTWRTFLRKILPATLSAIDNDPTLTPICMHKTSVRR